jgi:hypothetical protein
MRPRLYEAQTVTSLRGGNFSCTSVFYVVANYELCKKS